MRARMMAMVATATATMATLGGACDGTPAADCSVTINDTSIAGDTMTANGTFVTAQPLLILMMGATRRVIAGDDDGAGHATFDLTGLPGGTWDYSFSASCFDPDDSPQVDAPTGSFPR